MAAKPTAKETREKENKAWLLRCKCWTEQRIADELGVDVSTVCRMLKRKAEQLALELAQAASAMKAQQSAAHEQIAMEAMEAWEASKEDAVTVKSNEKERGVQKNLTAGQAEELLSDFDPESIPGLYDDEISSEERAQLIAEATAAHIAGKSKGRAVLTTEKTRTEERRYQVGDPRFLDQAQKAMAAIREIWGLDAPKKQEHSGGIGVTAVTGYDVFAPAPIHGTGDTSAERQD